MNILIPDSWLREYLDTPATPEDIQKYLSLCGPSIERVHKVGEDIIYDIEVTTNRPDCMSVIGLAREAAAILPRFNIPAKLKSDPLMDQPSLALSPKVGYLKVKIDSKLCPRFTAVLIKNVTVKSSPKQIIDQLEKVGQRGLNNTIDVTNLLMHEFGQPIHVFDYDKISKHTLILRPNKPGETITTLDGKKHTLEGEDIVIEDGSGSLIDLCGIMGGLNSSVTDHTKNVLLFVQTYSGSSIRRTSMSLAHRTAAAVLFEKNLPTEQVLPTLSQALKLIQKLSGGQPENQVLDILFADETPKTISLPSPLHTMAARLMGTDISSTQTSDILTSLNFKILSQNQIQVPYFRKFDIDIPEDLVEEIARIYGYHNIPPVLMTGALPSPSFDSTFYWENRIKTALKYFGFTECYSYSLVESDSGLKLKNPLSSDWVYLRTTLFPSHQKIIAANRGRVDEINLFEIANVYLPKPKDLPDEQSRLILSTTNPDYFLFKGKIAALLSDLGLKKLEPDIKSQSQILYWEIPARQLIDHATDIRSFTPISQYSSLVEDFNIITSETYATLIKQITHISPLITDIKFIDKYKDKLTLRLTFHDPKKQLSSLDIAPLRFKIQSLSAKPNSD